MLQRLCWAMLAALLLSGCGRGSEDFTVRIARPADRVMQALGHSALDGEMSGRFPGMKLARTEPVDGGQATVVHAAIDVPSVKVAFKGKAKVISETRVERAVHMLVQEIGSKLEEGGDTVTERRKFSQLLTVLGIVTDSRQLRVAMDMESNPDWYMGSWDALYDGGSYGDGADRPSGDAPVGDDPSAAARQQDYRDKERANEAAAPMDDGEGDPARGDGTWPEG